jgi:hypothetical protein
LKGILHKLLISITVMKRKKIKCAIPITSMEKTDKCTNVLSENMKQRHHIRALDVDE